VEYKALQVFTVNCSGINNVIFIFADDSNNNVEPQVETMDIEDNNESNNLPSDRLLCSGKMKQVDGLRIAVMLVPCLLLCKY